MKQEEHQLQSACVTWFRLQYRQKARLLFSIPNGATLAPASGPKINHLPVDVRRAMAWNKLEAEGAVPGAADLFLAIPSGDLCGLFIEMKTPTGDQSKTQERFEADVLAEGYGYAMPRSIEEFMRVVRRYLEEGVY